MLADDNNMRISVGSQHDREALFGYETAEVYGVYNYWKSKTIFYTSKSYFITFIIVEIRTQIQ